MENTSANHFLETVRFEFRKMKTLSEKALSQLTDDEFSKQTSPESNSVQIIVQHLTGNMLSRWTDFLTSDGEKSWRNRDGEFEVQKIFRKELMKEWEKGWNILLSTIDSISPDQLMQTIFIRKEPLTVTQALIRQIAHYSYHVGQIVQLSKEWKGSEWVSLSIPKGKSAEHQTGTYLGESK